MASTTYYISLISSAFKSVDVIAVHHATRYQAKKRMHEAMKREIIGEHERIAALSPTELQRLQKKGYTIYAP